MATHSSPTAPPQRRLRWAPPPSCTAPTSAPRIRVDVPYFNGVDPVGWIFKIQKYFDYFYTSDDHRLILVSIMIQHPASKWYRHYLCTNVDATWMDFLFAVKQQFDPDHFEDYSGTFSELQQDTTVVADQTEFETILNKVSGTDENTVNFDDTWAPGHQGSPTLLLLGGTDSDMDSLAVGMQETEDISTDSVPPMQTLSDTVVLDDAGEKKDGMTDALNATKATGEDGIVPGGDVSLLYASNELEKLPTASFDQKSGVQIIQNALKTPVHSVTSNAGVEGAVVVSKLLETDASGQRTVLVHGESTDQWRIPWPDGSPDSWEPVTMIRQHFPHIHLEDKVIFEDGGVDTYVPTSRTAGRTPRIRQRPTRFAEYVT